MSAVVELNEACIEHFVARFYELARADTELGPLFETAIKDWGAHLKIVADFWSHALLGTTRYHGTAYAVHTHLPIEWSHFDRWLAALEQSAAECLPAAAAERALARGKHMTMSFKAGLFPFPRKDGSWSKTP